MPMGGARETKEKERKHAHMEGNGRLPSAIGLELAHGAILDVGDVALADLHLYLFVLIQRH